MLNDPIVGDLKLQRANIVNRLFENNFASDDFPIVTTSIMWSISIACPFDFSKFPFDKNSCPLVLRFWGLDISMGASDRSWDTWRGLKGQSGTDGFKIEVKQIHLSNTTFNVYYFTDIELFITVKRQAPKYFYQFYIPCVIIVMASSFSFIIPLSAIPGRVALIVTQFLTLTNIFINQMVSTAS